MFVHSGALQSITPHEGTRAGRDDGRIASLRDQVAEETTSFLEMHLPELHDGFLEQYRGAKLHVVQRGPDWWTQGGASMRKLVKGVLHRAAPNEIVTPWAKQHRKAFDGKGRPTRGTKVDWLCEFIPNPPYRAFVKSDLVAALTCLDVLDASQHVDEYPEFAIQYNWLLLRVEVAIRHILAIWISRSTSN